MLGVGSISQPSSTKGYRNCIADDDRIVSVLIDFVIFAFYFLFCILRAILGFSFALLVVFLGAIGELLALLLQRLRLLGAFLLRLASLLLGLAGSI